MLERVYSKKNEDNVREEISQLCKSKEIMKKLHKLFFKIIRDILWKFLSEFWKLVKKDLLEFLKITALNIIKEKYKKYSYALSSLRL